MSRGYQLFLPDGDAIGRPFLWAAATCCVRHLQPNRESITCNAASCRSSGASPGELTGEPRPPQLWLRASPVSRPRGSRVLSQAGLRALQALQLWPHVALRRELEVRRSASPCPQRRAQQTGKAGASLSCKGIRVRRLKVCFFFAYFLNAGEQRRNRLPQRGGALGALCINRAALPYVSRHPIVRKITDKRICRSPLTRRKVLTVAAYCLTLRSPFGLAL
jgi:hypothetical protein